MILYFAKLSLQNSSAAPPYKMNQKLCLEKSSCKFLRTRAPVKWFLAACEVSPISKRYAAVKGIRLEKCR
jgi:hypothetical protein